MVIVQLFEEQTMPFSVSPNGTLKLGGKPRYWDIATVTIVNEAGSPHDVILQWAGLGANLRTYRLSPIEETLPSSVRETIESFRELQRGVLRYSITNIFAHDRQTSHQAREHMHLMVSALRSPLACVNPIQMRNLLSVWAPQVPDSSEMAVHIGTITHIQVS